jgi:hypothetical protein
VGVLDTLDVGSTDVDPVDVDPLAQAASATVPAAHRTATLRSPCGTVDRWTGFTRGMVDSWWCG